MKSFTDVAKEIEEFRSLKSDAQRKRIEDLRAQVEGLKSAISNNLKAIDKSKTDLEIAERKIVEIAEEYNQARERRQNAVALNEDDEKFRISISELNVSREYFQDRILGLQRRIENLTAEGSLLGSEMVESEKTIIRLRLIPLVKRWNEGAENLVVILKEMIILAEALGEGFGPFRTGATTIFYSDFEGLEKFSKFYLADEIRNPENLTPLNRLKGLFDFRAFQYERQAEREKIALTKT